MFYLTVNSSNIQVFKYYIYVLIGVSVLFMETIFKYRFCLYRFVKGYSIYIRFLQ